MAELGRLYLEGSGVGTPNHQAAHRWLLRAAEAGEGQAMMDLAWLLSESESLPRDYFEAAHWYRKAVEESGCFDAYLRLGSFHLNGQGVRKSAQEAYRWFSLGYASLARFPVHDAADQEELAKFSKACDQARQRLSDREMTEVETLLAEEKRKRHFDQPISFGVDD